MARNLNQSEMTLPEQYSRIGIEPSLQVLTHTKSAKAIAPTKCIRCSIEDFPPNPRLNFDY